MALKLSGHAARQSSLRETPTNPTLRLVNLEEAIAFARKHNLVSIIDNTFATPILQKPIAMGLTWWCTAPPSIWQATRTSSLAP
jgi:hypothetical protein